MQTLQLKSLLFLWVVATLVGCGQSESTTEAEAEAEAVTIELIQISAGGFAFDARVAGPEDGEPVILLHGFPQTSIEYSHQLQALGEAGYRAVAPNQRGYSPGARPADESAYVLVNLMLDILAIADAVGFERFHLVGHDWGASVAWFLGVFAPTRLLTLNPISVPHLDAFALTRNDPESCQYAASSYMDFFVQPDSHEVMLANDAQMLREIYAGLPDDHVQDYLDVLTRPGALKAALDWYRANITDGPSPGIGLVTVPTMYIWSTGDTALCRDGADLTENYVIGPYRYEVIEGVSHWVPEEAAETVSSLLIDHLGAH